MLPCLARRPRPAPRRTPCIVTQDSCCCQQLLEPVLCLCDARWLRLPKVGALCRDCRPYCAMTAASKGSQSGGKHCRLRVRALLNTRPSSSLRERVGVEGALPRPALEAVVLSVRAGAVVQRGPLHAVYAPALKALRKSCPPGARSRGGVVASGKAARGPRVPAAAAARRRVAAWPIRMRVNALRQRPISCQNPC